MPVQIEIAVCNTNGKGNGVFYLTPIENAKSKLYAQPKDIGTLAPDALKSRPLCFIMRQNRTASPHSLLEIVKRFSDNSAACRL